MCEKCDELREVLEKVENDFDARLTAFTSALITEQPDAGPTALTMALSQALGRAIGMAPQQIRAEVFQQSVKDTVAALNSVLPEGETVQVVTAAQKTYGGEQPRPEPLTIRPPILH